MKGTTTCVALLLPRCYNFSFYFLFVLFVWDIRLVNIFADWHGDSSMCGASEFYLPDWCCQDAIVHRWWEELSILEQFLHLYAFTSIMAHSRSFNVSVQPGRGRQRVKLLNDPIKIVNNWMDPRADNLTMKWSSLNISTNPNAQVDITLWGYWEDVEGHEFREVHPISSS